MINELPIVKSYSLAAAGTAGCSYEIHGINIGPDDVLAVESDDNNISFVVEGIKIAVADGAKRLLRINTLIVDSTYGVTSLVNDSESSDYSYTVSVYVANKDESNPSSFSIYVGGVGSPPES